MREAHTKWGERVQASLSLELLVKAQRDMPGQDERSGVSLVIHPQTGDLAMFQWTIPGKEGRVADVDENNYLKCIVPVGSKRVPLKIDDPLAILLPATGVRVLREKRLKRQFGGHDLNRLPDVLPRFMKIWRTAQSQSRGAVIAQAEEDSCCYMCGCASESCYNISSSADSRMVGHLLLCPMCLQCYHPDCFEPGAAGQLPELELERGDGDGTVDERLAAIIAIIPRVFDSAAQKLGQS